MIRRLGPIALLALTVLALPRAGAAQDVATSKSSSVEAPAVEPAAGPTLEGATAGFQRETVQGVRKPVVLAAARQSNSTALMIVGGAAFLAGAIIGDDAGTIIMVGGAAVGLYGLYLYLQ